MAISLNTLMIWPASSLVFRDNKTFQFALVLMTSFIIKKPAYDNNSFPNYHVFTDL